MTAFDSDESGIDAAEFSLCIDKAMSGERPVGRVDARRRKNADTSGLSFKGGDVSVMIGLDSYIRVSGSLA